MNEEVNDEDDFSEPESEAPLSSLLHAIRQKSERKKGRKNRMDDGSVVSDTETDQGNNRNTYPHERSEAGEPQAFGCDTETITDYDGRLVDDAS